MRRPSLLVALLVTTLLAGCGGRHSGDEPAASNAASTPPAATTSASSVTETTTMPAVSRYDSGPRAAESPVDQAQAGQGEKLFKTKGCAVCHAFGKKVTGPDLAGVTRRRTAVWIEKQILHPEVMTREDPIARDLLAKHSLQMPNQKLTEDEARAVIEYFKQKDREAGAAH